MERSPKERAQSCHLFTKTILGMLPRSPCLLYGYMAKFKLLLLFTKTFLALVPTCLSALAPKTNAVPQQSNWSMYHSLSAP